MNTIFDRRNFVVLLILVLFGVLILRLGQLTVVNGNFYRERANQSFIKQQNMNAKRGDIYDRDGNLLATSKPSFDVTFINFENDVGTLESVSIRLLNLLVDNGEKVLDFPLTFDGEIKYTSDLKIEKWLEKNGYNLSTTATEVLRNEREKYFIDPELDVFTAQELLIEKGVYLPISVKTMKFTDEKSKEEFLKMYDIPFDSNASAAYDILVSKSRIKPSKDYNVRDTLFVMAIKHAINLKGYYSYEPVIVASDIKKETAIQIQERKMDLSGVAIDINPLRSYPYGKTAAHVVGYLGNISSDDEIDKYLIELNYNNTDMIGKSGIEKKFETILHGTSGKKYVYADAKGNYVGEVMEGLDTLENITPVSGENITLSIDINLQQEVEKLLDETINKIQNGGFYESEWGDVQFDQFKNAKTGSVMVVDVKSGEILALVNKPSYDPNLFVAGISYDDWKDLMPMNPEDPLAPRPLYNIATMTSVQPGSVFKPLTVLAALEGGFNKDNKLYSDGLIKIGNQLFRCWYFKELGKKHGLLTVVDALMVSSNYIMYDLISGYDYYNKRTLGIDISVEKLLSYAERFGLGSSTGIEISERINSLPNEQLKKTGIKNSLEYYLDNNIGEYLLDSDINNEQVQEIIYEIISWTDEYFLDEIPRYEIINRLSSYSNIFEHNKIESLADLILYSYFKQMKWRVGDEFNLSIGQGDHRYTVAQIARYTAAIANDGYLIDLTLIKSDQSQISEENMIKLNNIENLYTIQEGMKAVANQKGGSLYSTFKSFPLITAGKTGTAQKFGQIPVIDEYKYILDNLVSILSDVELSNNVDLSSINEDSLKKEFMKLMIERNKEITALAHEISSSPDSTKKESLNAELDELISGNYLDEGNVMKDALLSLGNGEIEWEDIGKYMDDYDPYAWVASYAPYDDPQIAVVAMIPQGGHSYYAAPLIRDIYAYFFQLRASEE